MNPTRRRVTVALTVGALTFGLASVAIAQDSVTQTVNPGTQSASVADLDLEAVDYSHSEQTQTGTMVLSADDSSATGDGWNVTVQTSDFVSDRVNGDIDIPAANFALTSAATPTTVAGQEIDTTGGPYVGTDAVGTLDEARKVIAADADFGQGDYRQDLDVSLTIPAQTRAGEYTGTLTTTITTGP